jgi:hypothetical protein
MFTYEIITLKQSFINDYLLVKLKIFMLLLNLLILILKRHYQGSLIQFLISLILTNVHSVFWLVPNLEFKYGITFKYFS